MGAPAELQVDRVVAGYLDGIDILSGLTLNAAPKRITAVIGPNGAGKSTLLRVVFGLLPARGGRVIFAGREIHRLRPDERKRLGIAYVPQGASTFPHMTVDETLRVGGWTVRGDRVRLRKGINQMYDLFPALAGLRRTRAGLLSGGQLRMLAIAKEIVVPPALLLVDEPTAGLAPRVAQEVYRLLEQTRALGITVLLVDQNITDAVAVADDVYLVNMGAVQRAGSREAFASDLSEIVRETLIGPDARMTPNGGEGECTDASSP